jgi:phi LC3 family holin
MDIKKRLKDVWFWVTLGALFFTATGIEPNNMTSWSVLGEAVLKVASNPFLLVSFLLAVLGQFRNPTTKGMKD